MLIAALQCTSSFPSGFANAKERDVKLSFHGADRDVTGSCHLVECAGKRILIDCGLFQGSRALAQENAEPFGFDAAAVDLVLLTHAHLDHCGRLPLLCKRGFRGELIATAATRALARRVMLEAPHLREEEARSAAVKAARRNAGAETGAPLYSLPDALGTLEYFRRGADYGAALQLAAGVAATFSAAGPILGSACILLQLEETGRAQRVLFSGDLGNAGRPLLPPPAAPPRTDVVVIETHYGDRSEEHTSELQSPRYLV